MPQLTPETRHLLDLESDSETLPDQYDLCTDAARAAAETLAGNWQDAMHDGTPLSDLVDDIDDVILALRLWRDVVAKNAANL